MIIFSLVSTYRNVSAMMVLIYTARNVTHLLQVVDFTGLLQDVNKLPTSCSKSVDFIRLQQVCESQSCCNLIFVDLVQIAELTCIKLVDKMYRQSTCSKPVDNLQQTCYHQARASDANASWYWLDDSKTTHPTANLLQLARFWLCTDPPKLRRIIFFNSSPKVDHR